MTRCLHGTCDSLVRPVVHSTERVEVRCMAGHSFWPDGTVLDARPSGTMYDPLFKREEIAPRRKK